MIFAILFASLIAFFSVTCFVGPWSYVHAWKGAGRKVKWAILVPIAFFILVCFQAMIHIVATYGAVELRGGICLNIGSAGLFPLNLIMLHYFFLARSQMAFRLIALSVLVVNVGFACGTLVIRNGWINLYGLNIYKDLWSEAAGGKLFGGAALFLADLIVLALSYRLARKCFESYFMRVWLPVACTLLVDAVIYSLLVYKFDGGSLSGILLGHIVGKAISGSAYAYTLSLYIRMSQEKLTDAPSMSLDEFVTAFCFGISVVGSQDTPPFKPSTSSQVVPVMPTKRNASPSKERSSTLPSSEKSDPLTSRSSEFTIPQLTPLDDYATRAIVMDDSDDKTHDALPEVLWPADGESPNEPLATSGPNVALHEAARQRFAEDLEDLRREGHDHKWIAYHGVDRVGTPAISRTEAYKACRERGLQPGTFTLFRVEPGAERVSVITH